MLETVSIDITVIRELKSENLMAEVICDCDVDPFLLFLIPPVDPAVNNYPISDPREISRSGPIKRVFAVSFQVFFSDQKSSENDATTNCLSPSVVVVLPDMFL